MINSYEMKKQLQQAMEQRLPQASVFWEPPITPQDYERNSCTLVVTLKMDAAQKFTFKFPEGIGDQIVEEYVNDFSAEFMDSIRSQKNNSQLG